MKLIRTICALFLPEAPTQSQAPYLYKNRGWAHPAPEWRPSCHVDLPLYLSFPFLAPSFLSFTLSFPLFFFSFFFPFPFFFGAPLVTAGGRGPKAPQDTPLGISQNNLHLLEK